MLAAWSNLLMAGLAQAPINPLHLKLLQSLVAHEVLCFPSPRSRALPSPVQLHHQRQRARCCRATHSQPCFGHEVALAHDLPDLASAAKSCELQPCRRAGRPILCAEVAFLCIANPSHCGCPCSRHLNAHPKCRMGALLLALFMPYFTEILAAPCLNVLTPLQLLQPECAEHTTSAEPRARAAEMRSSTERFVPARS